MRFHAYWSFTGLLLLASVLGMLSFQASEVAPSDSASLDGDVWSVTDVREVMVDGTPLTLSPDGQWLAGFGYDSKIVCAWRVERLEPTCAAVASSTLQPTFSNFRMAWAPDSTAFAFVEGSSVLSIPGDVYVFDVTHAELSNLTNTGDRSPYYLGMSWTPDSQQVVFAAVQGTDADGNDPDVVVRMDREGGDFNVVPLPNSWFHPYEIVAPPLVIDQDAYVAINAGPDSSGIWRIGLENSNANLEIAEHGGWSVNDPAPVSATSDGNYLFAISREGVRRLNDEDTYFLFNTKTRELEDLASRNSTQMISFAPNGRVGLLPRWVDDGYRLYTRNLASGETTPVIYSPRMGIDPWLAGAPIWAANDTVFLPHGKGGTLVKLSSADSS